MAMGSWLARIFQASKCRVWAPGLQTQRDGLVGPCHAHCGGFPSECEICRSAARLSVPLFRFDNGASGRSSSSAKMR